MQKEIVRKELIEKIEKLLLLARQHVASTINSSLLVTYMEIGKTIYEDRKENCNVDNYETKSLNYLSKVLSKNMEEVFQNTT